MIEGKYAIDLYKEQVLKIELSDVFKFRPEDDEVSGGSNTTETTPHNIQIDFAERLLI